MSDEKIQININESYFSKEWIHKGRGGEFMDKKVVEYNVVYASMIDDLIFFVNQEIERGFQPSGEIEIKCQVDDLVFYQVMVKYE